MKPVINAGKMFDIPTGTMFAFGKPLPKVDMAPEHYIDTTPDYTREQEEKLTAMMTALPKGDGFISGAEVVERMKHLIGGEPTGVIVVMDSYSPMT